MQNDNIILFDADARQNFAVGLEGSSGETIKVIHSLAPLTNARFFEMAAALEITSKAVKPSEALKPKIELWRELCAARKTADGSTIAEADEAEIITVINLLTSFQTIPATEADENGAFDESAAFKVLFLAAMSETAVILALTFRALDVADQRRLNEIRTAATGQNSARAVYDFGVSLLTNFEGYKQTELEKIPAWHIIGAIADVVNGCNKNSDPKIFSANN